MRKLMFKKSVTLEITPVVLSFIVKFEQYILISKSNPYTLQIKKLGLRVFVCQGSWGLIVTTSAPESTSAHDTMFWFRPRKRDDKARRHHLLESTTRRARGSRARTHSHTHTHTYPGTPILQNSLSPGSGVQARSEPRRGGPLPEEVLKRKLRSGAGSWGSRTQERAAPAAEAPAAGARRRAIPAQLLGRTRVGGGPGQFRGLTWSCWLRAVAATASRAGTSTFLQLLRAPPRPHSPRLPRRRLRAANLIPPSSGRRRGSPPWSPPPPPPSPRAASPVQSEEVEESQRLRGFSEGYRETVCLEGRRVVGLCMLPPQKARVAKGPCADP
ncbi:uncharacterized protein [Oryctolagus cuniculus]|uniref:uncharacterized protein n=1 Tax=Oryctolagus cuniculus TaxID=9986 RepID=UPI0038795B62